MGENIEKTQQWTYIWNIYRTLITQWEEYSILKRFRHFVKDLWMAEKHMAKGFTQV